MAEDNSNYSDWKNRRDNPSFIDKNNGDFSGVQPVISLKESIKNDGLKFLTRPVWLKDLIASAYSYEFVWDDFIAFGHITTLSAHPKVGKSTLMGSLFKAMEEEGVFLERQTHRYPVLIVSEESEHHWVYRRDRLGLTLPITVWCSPLTHRLTAKEWEEFVGEIKKYCEANDIKFVVFDTISKFWSVKDENASADMDAAFLPLNILKTENYAVLLVHHFRKAGGDYGLGARGSSVFGATPDCLIDFVRADDNKNPTARRIMTISRFPNAPDALEVDFDGLSYYKINLKQLKKQQKQNYIKNILLEIMKTKLEGGNIDDILENWDQEDLPKKGVLKNDMGQGLKDGVFLVSKKEKHRGGTIYYYQPVIKDIFSKGVEWKENDGLGTKEEINK